MTKFLLREFEHEAHPGIARRHQLPFNQDAVYVAAQHGSETDADVRIRSKLFLSNHSVLNK